jgi:hypothetical protein
MAALSLFLRSLVFENDPQYLSPQYTLKIRSLSMVWNENDRFWLVFTKMLVFMPKTWSLHTGTGHGCTYRYKFFLFKPVILYEFRITRRVDYS